MEISNISVSRQKTFSTCPQQYKYKYHLKLASPKPEPEYFVYGKVIHKVAEHYVKNKGEIPINSIVSDVLQRKIPIDPDRFCPDLTDEYKKKLVKHVKAVKNITDKIGYDGLIEYYFNYDLDPPNGKYAKGFLDRLILRDENGKPCDGITTKATRAFIIDYKTTKKGKYQANAETIKDDVQLRVYCRVVQKEFKIEASNIKAALYYLEGERLIGAQYSEESLINAEKDLLYYFNTIQKSDPDKVWGRVGWHCKNCDYEKICPFNREGAGEIKWDGDVDKLGHDGWGE